ncbi:MAG: ketose-bisphosphate aldolase [Christensenellales bacterium]
MDTIFISFEKALKKHFSIGAFNFYNLETLQAILEAGEECCMPVICSVSESAIKYMGLDATVMMFEALTQKKKYPAYLHLDHGQSYEICKKAIDAGFDSVMIDGSSLPYSENVKLTKKVVKYADKNGVFVEGEIGVLSGIEENLIVAEKEAKFTSPKEAKSFVLETGINSVAVAIGTSHGAYKFKGEPHLRIDILTEIEKELGKFPIVLHGASTIDPKIIKQINARGGKIKNAKGVSKDDLKEICKNHNVCKINVDTDLRLAFLASIRQTLKASPKETNPRYFLTEAKEYMKEIVKQKINLFSGKY